MTVGGRTTRQCAASRYLVRGERLIGPEAGADIGGMIPRDAPPDVVRDRALELAAEHGVDPASWYIRVLEEDRSAGSDPDLGALVRVYWELQRITGRADLKHEWRRLADVLWSGEAA